jgi:hypothetical protein
MFNIKDSRRIPSIIVFTVSLIPVFLSVALAVWINLDDQAAGLTYWSPSMAKDFSVPYLGTAQRSWWQACFFDNSMVWFEAGATFAFFWVGHLKRDLDALMKFNPSKDNMLVVQLQRDIEDFEGWGYHLTYAFLLAASVSVFFVATHYVTNVQGRGFLYYMRCVIALLPGLLTPGFIFGSMAGWLILIKALLGLLIMPRVPVPGSLEELMAMSTPAAAEPVAKQVPSEEDATDAVKAPAKPSKRKKSAPKEVHGAHVPPQAAVN